MNVDFFESEIIEELHSAKLYAKLAIEHKVSNPTWAKVFLELSQDELKHAKAWFNMWTEYYSTLSTAYKEIPKYVIESNEFINDEYSDCLVEIRILQEAYTK